MKELTVDLENLEPRQRAIVVAIRGGVRITGRVDAMGIGTILSPCATFGCAVRNYHGTIAH